MYVTSDATLAGGQVIEDARWYLGLTCTLLPGYGFGVDAVEEGSPAAEVGLAPGMLLTHVNDIPLLDDGDLPSAIEVSGGSLNITVSQEIDGELLSASATIEMRRLVSQSF